MNTESIVDSSFKSGMGDKTGGDDFVLNYVKKNPTKALVRNKEGRRQFS